MIIDIISVVPELLVSPLSHSIVQRARDKGIAEINLIGLREYGIGAYKALDDYPYGGGGGMVLRCEPLADCIENLLNKNTYDHIIYLTPDGELLRQPLVNRLSTFSRLMMICGHYKGVDQRIREKYVTLEISVGDYVLSGGELAAAVLTDAIVRVIPGAIGDEMSALTDSFQDNLLAPPVYTRPEVWDNRKVPDILLSGNDKAITEWRMEESLRITALRRPDLLDD
jgi:tRNA (guanine37-N1)-methyltransferase